MCPACASAEQHPTRDEFAAGCRSCMARALAVTRVDVHGQKRAREILARVFGQHADEGEQLVRDWLGKMRQQAAQGRAP